MVVLEVPVIGGAIEVTLDDFLVGLFILGWIMVLAIGLILMLVSAVFFSLNGLRPLSGDGAGTKHTLFLLGLIGYSIPFFGIFPWLIPWSYYVARHPE